MGSHILVFLMLLMGPAQAAAEWRELARLLAKSVLRSAPQPQPATA